MYQDVPFRFVAALDAASLTTIDSALDGAVAAIADCHRAGRRADQDPAVLLLLRRLGGLATAIGDDDASLRHACFEIVRSLRRQPLLETIASRGVAFDATAKRHFHVEGRRALTKLADALGYERGDYDLRTNTGGPAVSGEITLHSPEAYVQLGSHVSGGRVLFRRCRNRRDHCGGPNHFATIAELTEPTALAARICRELRLPTPADTVRLVA